MPAVRRACLSSTTGAASYLSLGCRGGSPATPDTSPSPPPPPNPSPLGGVTVAGCAQRPSGKRTRRRTSSRRERSLPLERRSHPFPRAGSPSARMPCAVLLCHHHRARRSRDKRRRRVAACRTPGADTVGDFFPALLASPIAAAAENAALAARHLAPLGPALGATELLEPLVALLDAPVRRVLRPSRFARRLSREPTRWPSDVRDIAFLPRPTGAIFDKPRSSVGPGLSDLVQRHQPRGRSRGRGHRQGAASAQLLHPRRRRELGLLGASVHAGWCGAHTSPLPRMLRAKGVSRLAFAACPRGAGAALSDEPRLSRVLLASLSEHGAPAIPSCASVTASGPHRDASPTLRIRSGRGLRGTGNAGCVFAGPLRARAARRSHLGLPAQRRRRGRRVGRGVPYLHGEAAEGRVTPTCSALLESTEHGIFS